MAVPSERRGPFISDGNQIWSASSPENEASFFDRPTTSAAKDPQTASSRTLEQKASTDVFEPLNPSSHQAPDTLWQPTETATGQGSAQKHENGKVQEKTLDGKGNNPADISALWDAVLDDDDFLAEDSDGFLPDSRPESSPESPSSLVGSLNDGTRFQEPDEVLERYDSRSSGCGPASTQNDQGPQWAGQQTSNPYAPHQPSSSDLAQLSPTTHGNVGLSRPNLAPISFGQSSFQGQLQRPPAPSKAESFVDQSKGGYKSPYDLPMDLSKPRKRVQQQHPQSTPGLKGPAPPPRSSSMVSDQQSGSFAGPLQSPVSPATATFEGQGRPPSSHKSTAPSSVNRSVSNEQPNGLKSKTSSPSFFEELPFTAKPRSQTAQGRYTPAQTGALPSHVPPASPAAHQLQPSTHMPPPPIPTKKSSADSYAQYQLQRPERLDPYANVPLQPSAAPVVLNTRYSPAPPTSQTAPPLSRYSPAPPSSQTAPPPSAPSRYSPAPPPQSNVMNRYASQPQSSPHIPSHTAMSQSRYPTQQVPPVANVLPFQPRTSSPLAYHGKQPDPRVEGLYETSDRIPASPPSRVPPPQHAPPPVESPPSSADPVQAHPLAPPRRSQTQSPGKRGPVSSLVATSDDVMQRPASVHGPSSPTASANSYQSFPPSRPSVRQRGLSQHLNFIPPTDECQNDELQRWRGSPIFRFGLGGSVLSSFPKHIPRYAAGSAMPMIKPMAGEVQVRSAKETLPDLDHIAKFPGPLRSRSKKKDVLVWLSDRIAALESVVLPTFSQQLPDPIKRHEERVLLWKLMRVIVEHDGAVDGNAEAQKAINLFLSPASVSGPDLPSTSNVLGSDVAVIYKPQGTISNTVTVDPGTVESIRRSLLRGEREKAVWTAVDNRLWAHAMLLSSTLDKSVWKQVAHEFVRQEIKRVGVNTESLAALYEIFAGNLEESVDELVPPSARAGLQMVSKIGGAGPTKSASEGLDRWRETLGLVLNNRSPDDQKALAALGGLLGSYGRIEASHICHLFAIPPTMPTTFGGSDDPQASIVLLGADHRNQPNGFFLDEDAVLLTEVYEFASSVLASGSKSALMPHLQAYKLQRVRSLAEAGFKTEAQAYCDAMGASLRSTTKLSLYYHPQFLAELDDLTQRLSQAPTETSSWISKPTMGKVSDSMWNKFTTFVAGDESDAASTGSGRDAGHEFGPFAKISGTPTMSRSGSSSDLYGSYATAAPQTIPNTIAGSKYAPNGQYSARSSSELTRGKPSLDSQRSASYMPQGPIQKSPHDPNGPLSQQSSMSPPIPLQSSSPYAPFGASPQVQAHQATPPQTSYMPMAPPDGQPSPSQHRQPESYVPTPPAMQPGPYMQSVPPPAIVSKFPAENRHAPSFGGYLPPDSEPQASPPQDTSDYAPPVQPYSSYEPPSTEYVPYQPDPSSDSESKKPQARKKSFMDDDDFPSSNYAPQTNPPPNSINEGAASIFARKKANDAATEAAFLAAAEADAARDKTSSTQAQQTLKPKSSWFSLFSRKDPNSSLDPGSTGNKPSGAGPGEQKVIRAKLGEESSFYYDKELKKWINKKDPAGMQQQGAKATPPPPKGPVSRVVSESGVGGGGPPAGPPRSGFAAPPPSLSSSRPGSSNGVPSRAGTPGEGSVGIPAVGPMAPPPDGRESAPPSASAGLGGGGSSAAPAPPPAAPTVRPASAALSTASDIDDLLGGPPTAGGRKPGGTLKAKKGRGRYVDVMAK